MMPSYSEIAPIFQEHSLMMIVAILSLAFTIGLKTLKITLLQFVLLLTLISFYSIDGSTANILAFLIAAIQVFFFLLLLFKIKGAIDYDYHLVIEKTHEVPRKITREGNLGTRRSFF